MDAVQDDLGQHLLVDAEVIERMLKAANVHPGDVALDPGAGEGALTRPLAVQVGDTGKVYAIELDDVMVARLQRLALQNVIIAAGDALRVALPTTLDVVVANPPFKVAAPLLERLVRHPTGRIVSIVPAELAERLLAAPGSERYGRLTVRIALRARLTSLGPVSRRAFAPPPDVPCALLRLDPAAPRPAFDDDVLDLVLDAAWSARGRKAKRALAHVPTDLRLDTASFLDFVAAQGWSDTVATALPPAAFGEIAAWLTAARAGKPTP